MSVADVQQAVLEVMETGGTAGGTLRQNGTGMRYAIIDPILWALGWRTWLPWECQPDYDLRSRGSVDYALFDSNGDIAVLIVVRHSLSRRRNDRIRLWEYTRGMTDGAAVLTYGLYWEIYDLSITARNIDDKRVAAFTLDTAAPEGFPDVADALSAWIDRDQWP